MRRVVLLALLAIVLPLATWADSVDVTNFGGTITGSSTGLSLGGSTLVGYEGIFGTNLGTVSFTTGAFLTGNAKDGGTLAPGGTFTIMGNGTSGVPSGVIFAGTFSSAEWELKTLSNGTHDYVLIGTLVSPSGGSVAATTQITVNTHKGFFTGSVGLSSGDTALTVPEPGTLGLLGTGLVGIGGLLRHKRVLG